MRVYFDRSIGKTMLMRAVVEYDSNGTPTLVTAYRTSKLDKYLGGTL